MIRRRLVVRGDVQGVFFRDGLREEAERHGIAGWVRNADDGSVEAELEGEAADVEAVVAWCREGSDRARVEDVEVAECAPEGATGFAVR